MFGGDPGAELFVNVSPGFLRLLEFSFEVELPLSVELDAREDLLLVLILHHSLLQQPLLALSLLSLVANENLVSSAIEVVTSCNVKRHCGSDPVFDQNCE